MRTLLLLPLLLTFMLTGQTVAQTENDSPVTVLDFKYYKTQQKMEKQNSESRSVPAAEMITDNKIYQRTARAQAPPGTTRDPNVETVDGRSAILEKNVQEARSPKTTTVEGYEYLAKIRNGYKQNIEVIFWEYQFKERANPANVIRRQFLCSVNIKPDKEKELQVFSALGPGDVVSAASLNNGSKQLFEENVVINRVEFADGAILQRKSWNFAEMKPSIERAVKTPWGREMCRGL
jgi:hypothetical protein